MTTEIETLVTQQMIDTQGVWSEWGPWSDEVTLSDIRRFAIGSYYPEIPPRQFWDEDFAKTTRYGGIIAPQDFNPFAWAVKQWTQDATWPGTGQGTHGMNGGQSDVYGVPIRAGDRVRARTRLRDWHERISRLGLTMFTYTEREWRNQNDELVRLRTSVSIRY